MKTFYLAIFVFVLTAHVARGQHTLKDFTGNSDFLSSDVIIENSCINATLKTKGVLTFNANVNRLENFTISCSKSVKFPANVKLTIKGTVTIRTSILVLAGKIDFSFADNNSKIIIEYEELDDSASISREFSITKFSSVQISLIKKDTNCL